MTWKHTNNRMQEKPNNFRVKYDNQENITEKTQMDKQYNKKNWKGMKKARKQKYKSIY